jgi:hypothetical protein
MLIYQLPLIAPGSEARTRCFSWHSTSAELERRQNGANEPPATKKHKPKYGAD